MGMLKDKDKEVIWHPYTPMKIRPDSIGIVKGKGVYLQDEQGSQYIDAISSWWVNLHGHSHPYIAEKVSEQLLTLEHCIFAGFTHEPAIRLAERLLPLLPGEMKKVFYSDNGSTAVEVAIKMALQYWSNKGKPRKKLVALEGAYHGDTFGAMSVSERSIFTQPFGEKLFDVEFIPFAGQGKEQESIENLEALLQNGDIAAFIAEPLVQGTAGMRMYSADTLASYFRLCRKHDTIIIADEVMTGFGRTGPLFACNAIAEEPDIVCLSKGLTGGTMPLGLTATTQRVFDAFYDDDILKTLYHGHSYTANPLACTAGLASLDLLLDEKCAADRLRIEQMHSGFAELIRGRRGTMNVRNIGTILALDLDTGAPGSYTSSKRDIIYSFFMDRKILLRPLGNIIYLMPPYCISNEELQYIYKSIIDLLDSNTLF